MTVELLVMRHAKSSWDGGAPDDFSRPLAPRGHRAATRMAAWLEDEDLEPDLIVTSAANRARTTAQYVADHFRIGAECMTVQDHLYGAGASTWIDLLRPQSAPRILICGHNPGLDDLVDRLSRERPELTANGKLMTTAAIAHLEFSEWAAVDVGTGRLRALVRPREL